MIKIANVLAVAFMLSIGISTASARQDVDNTKTNKRAEQGANADKARNGKSDLQLMRDIRRSVVKDKSLSTYAHNVKIVARGGKVTLKGPVKSEEEKKAIEQKATEVAGAENVTDQLTVKASNQ